MLQINMIRKTHTDQLDLYAAYFIRKPKIHYGSSTSYFIRMHNPINYLQCGSTKSLHNTKAQTTQKRKQHPQGEEAYLDNR